MELHCLNPVANTRKTPLPPLEDLAEGKSTFIHAGLKNGSEPRKELDKTLRAADRLLDGFPKARVPCIKNLAINTTLGADGAMTRERVHAPEGAKTVVLSF